MGERNWHQRYRDARDYADEQASAYKRGDEISNWRYVTIQKPGEPNPPTERLTGAAWVAWAYEIARDTARTLVQVKGASWQPLVDECERLMQEYQEKASNPA
jgi:hypothetical protein